MTPRGSAVFGVTAKSVTGLAILFLVLDGFPLFEHSAGIACVAGSEHMRVPSDQFIRNFVNNLVDVEAPSLARDLRVHHYQQEQIAQFLPKMRADS